MGQTCGDAVSTLLCDEQCLVLVRSVLHARAGNLRIEVFGPVWLFVNGRRLHCCRRQLCCLLRCRPDG